MRYDSAVLFLTIVQGYLVKERKRTRTTLIINKNDDTKTTQEQRRDDDTQRSLCIGR
jgi:hypothetical protein